MSCSLDKIKSDALDSVKAIIKGNATSVDLKDTYAVFNYGDEFKVKHMESARKHAETKQKKVEEWAESTFGKAFSGGWTSLKTTPSSVILDISFPHRLSEAYRRKIDMQNAIEEEETIREYEANNFKGDDVRQTMAEATRPDYVYNGEVYASYEDMMAAKDADEMDDLYMIGNNQSYAPVHHLSYVANKQNLLDKLERKLESLNSMSNTHRSDKKYLDQIEREYAMVNRHIGVLREQIAALNESGDIYDRILNTLESDFQFVEQLLSGDTSNVYNIEVASHIINAFEQMSDYSGNQKNMITRYAKRDDIHPKLRDMFVELNDKLQKYKGDLMGAKKNLVLNIIENSPEIRTLYGDGDWKPEDILQEMMADKKDLDVASYYTLSVDKSFLNDDGLFTQMFIENLKNHLNNEKSTVITFKQRIDELQDDVEKVLRRKGYGHGILPINRFQSHVSYDIFFQKGPYGRTSKIVDVYSKDWSDLHSNFIERFNANYNDAVANRDWERKEKLLRDKHLWLSNRVDFFDLTLVPEIIEAPEFQMWAEHFGSKEEAETYRQKVISRIGKYNYEKMVVKQTQMLERYKKGHELQVAAKMDEHNVKKFEDLPANIQANLSLNYTRQNPILFLKSQQNSDPSQRGMINIDNGDNNSRQLRGEMMYNTYFPKTKLNLVNKVTGEPVTKDSGFYDENFSKISEEPTLLKFWEIVYEANEYLHQSLAQSGMHLSKGDIVSHQRAFAEIIFSNESMKQKFVNGSKYMYRGVSSWMKELFTIKEHSGGTPIEDVNKGDISMVQEEVGKLSQVHFLRLKNLLGKDITGSTAVTLSTAPKDVQQVFIDLDPAANTIEDVISRTGDNIRVRKVVRGYMTEKLMAEQTSNLPVLLKAYLDKVSEYSARKKAMGISSVLKDLHNEINLDTGKKENKDDKEEAAEDAARQKDKPKRERSNKRFEDSYRKNILNISSRKTWGSLGMKFYDSNEAKVIREINTRLKDIGKALAEQEAERQKPGATAEVEERIAALSDEKEALQNMKENMGRSMAASMLWESFVNRLSRFKGLSWNIKAAFKNVAEGYRATLVHDNGKYAKPGAMMAAQGFFYRTNTAGRLWSPDNNERRKANLLIAYLDILKDGTNEFERNNRKSGSSGMAWYQPFKPTEVTEGMIQKPQILGMLTNETISYTDENGVVHNTPIFDGNKFPAFSIKNGKLVLKDKYKINPDGTPNTANINKWEKFQGAEFNKMKNKIDNNLTELNGAYGQTDTMILKNNPLTASFAVFKTWFPNYLWTRFAKNQRVLATGNKNYNGYYTGTINSMNTSIMGSMAVSGNMALAGMNKGLLIPGLIGSAAALTGGAMVALPMAVVGGYRFWKLKKAAESGVQNISAAAQIAMMLKGTLSKTIGMPLNMATSIAGKKVFDGYTYDDVRLTAEEQANMNALTTEMVLNLYSAMLKIGVTYLGSLLLLDDEEEENKYIDDPLNPGKKKLNEAYIEQKEPDPIYASLYNILQNEITTFLDDGLMFYSAGTATDLVGRRNVIFSTLDEIIGVEKAVQSWIHGKEIISKGKNAGESRVFNAFTNLTMPTVGAELIHALNSDGEYDLETLPIKMLGYDSAASLDFSPNTGIDRWFDTDLKVDTERREAERRVKSAELRKYWEDNFDYKNIENKLDRDIIKSIIDDEIKLELDTKLPMPDRNRYDKEQKKKY